MISISETSAFDGSQIIEEELDVGLTDLCNGNPNTVAVFLLSGSLQAIHLRIMVRYLSNGKVDTRDMDVSNGFWHIECLFSKKKT